MGFDLFRPKQQNANKASDWHDTVVFMHGILGSRRNWRTPANLFIRSNPTFQAFTLDHRGHGGSRGLVGGSSFNTVHSCAEDLEEFLHSPDVTGKVLMATPEILVAHSFGGKVALNYLTDRLVRGEPIPKHTWILDSLPGPYVESRRADGTYSVNSVAGIFDALRAEAQLQADSSPQGPRFPSTKAAVDMLLNRGVALPIAQWLTTGCYSPEGPDNPNKHVTFSFDLLAVTQLFSDFCAIDAWPWLEAFDGRGASKDGGDAFVHYVRAGKNKMWSERDVAQLDALDKRGTGVRYHCMEHVGHWLHVDDVEGLISLLSENSR